MWLAILKMALGFASVPIHAVLPHAKLTLNDLSPTKGCNMEFCVTTTPARAPHDALALVRLDVLDLGRMDVGLVPPLLPTSVHQHLCVKFLLNSFRKLECLQLWLGSRWLLLGLAICSPAPVVASIVLIGASWLTIVGPGAVVAVMIVELQSVRTVWILVDVQEAI